MAGPKKFRNSGKKRDFINIELELPVMDEETKEQKVIDEEEQWKTETFRCHPRIPGALLLDIASAGTIGESYQAASMRRFFDYAIVSDDLERWNKTLEEADPPIELEMLSDIMAYLMGQYTENPTSESASS
jgi:hypothetical protein